MHSGLGQYLSILKTNTLKAVWHADPILAWPSSLLYLVLLGMADRAEGGNRCLSGRWGELVVVSMCPGRSCYLLTSFEKTFGFLQKIWIIWFQLSVGSTWCLDPNSLSLWEWKKKKALKATQKKIEKWPSGWNVHLETRTEQNPWKKKNVVRKNIL